MKIPSARSQPLTSPAHVMERRSTEKTSSIIVDGKFVVRKESVLESNVESLKVSLAGPIEKSEEAVILRTELSIEQDENKASK